MIENAPDPDPAGVFVGRIREAAVLRAALRDAAEGRGRVVSIAGEPGIGKTALAEHAARHARSLGMRVVWGSCWEGGGAPEYWPWLQAIRAYAAERSTTDLANELGAGATIISRVIPEIAQRFLSLSPESEETDPERARFRLLDALAIFLRSAAAAQPMMIVLDDLHWADHASLILLRFLARDVHTARIVVVVTYREAELSADDEISEIFGAVAHDRITLSGLASDEVSELMERTVGSQAAEDVVATIHHRTTGNPLFVKELARLLDAQGRLQSAGATLPIAIPRGIRDVIERRIARLSQSCAEVLGVASVLGGEMRLDVLEATSGVDRHALLAAVDEAIEAGILVEVPDAVARYAFTHALIRETVYGGLTQSRRAALHLAAGEAFEAAYAENRETVYSELAYHFTKAIPAGAAERASIYSTRAGARALGMFAYDDAAAHFRRALDALDLAGKSLTSRIRVTLNLADALSRSGDLPLARETYRKVAPLAREANDPEALAHAALGLGTGLAGFEVRMFDEEQIALLREAVEALPNEDSALRAWLLARSSVATTFIEAVEDRATTARAAVDMARRTDDKTALAYALGALCDAIAGPDHIAERISAATEIVHLAEEIRAQGGAACGIPSCESCLCDPEMGLLGRRFLIVAHLERADMALFQAELDAYARISEHLRQPLYRWYAPLWAGLRPMLRGAWDAWERTYAEARAIGERAHSENAAVLCLTQRMNVARLCDEGDEVARNLDGMLALLPGISQNVQGRIAVAWANAWRGDVAAARAGLRQLSDDGFEQLPVDSEWLVQLCTIAETAWLLDDPTPASAVFDLLKPYEELLVVDGIGAGLFGSVAHSLGRLASLLGRDDQATAHFEAALRTYARIGADALTPLAQRDHARALTRSGKGARRAARLIDAAVAGYLALGLERSAEITRGLRSVLPADDAPAEGTFTREGEFWTVGIGDAVARVKHSKGIADIAMLIARPRAEVHAAELYAGPGERPGAGAEGLSIGEGDTGPILDERARSEYKRRVEDLREELREAEENNDTERAARAREAIEFIAAELSGAFGLGGRARKSGDPAERARKAVTERIRDALGRLDKAAPDLSKHLRRSIRTGTFCAYDPDERVVWTL